MLAALTACATTWAQSFELAPLPYPHNALAPVIDEQTMQIHHGRHHKAYVDNLNAAIAKDPALQGKSLEALHAVMSQLPVAVRNNGGGHWNHTFFWQSMTRPGQGGAPSAALQAAINRDFGSQDAFKAAFKAAGLGRFGSGWAWLIVGADGKLKITSTPNQDNPLMDLVPERGTPLLGNDVWEHAYYLQYQNKRGDYLDAWWQVVDWNVVSTRYAAAAAPTTR
ncbi:MAG: superoxide dismutase [Sinobacteraceae bacterium]|nr:superoxide dismutase [Nevskiaceae bacterium]